MEKQRYLGKEAERKQKAGTGQMKGQKGELCLPEGRKGMRGIDLLWWLREETKQKRVQEEDYPQ